MSLLIFVTRAAKLDHNFIKLLFRHYVEVQKDNEYETNSLNIERTPAINIELVYNSTGSYYFLSLVTGQHLTQV